MLIAALQKLTLLDYPDKIAALIFTQGCNFYCGYCHNPEMIPKKRVLPMSDDLTEKSVLKFLKTRKGLLDGVVISGGEPTLQEDLESFIKKIKKLGFLVKLDTNGSHPEILQNLLKQKLLDYIAMDIKQSEIKYEDLVKANVMPAIRKSITLIKDSGVDYEFRSTILPLLHSEKEIEAMGKMIKGAERWYLQNFRPLKTLKKSFQKERPFSSEELVHLQKIAKPYAKVVEIRNS